MKLNKKHSESNIFMFYRTENITDEKREWGLCSKTRMGPLFPSLVPEPFIH